MAADLLLLDISQDTKHAWQQPCVADRNIAFVLTLYVAAGVSAAGLTLARLSMISSSLLWWRWGRSGDRRRSTGSDSRRPCSWFLGSGEELFLQ